MAKPLNVSLFAAACEMFIEECPGEIDRDKVQELKSQLRALASVRGIAFDEFAANMMLCELENAFGLEDESQVPIPPAEKEVPIN